MSRPSQVPSMFNCAECYRIAEPNDQLCKRCRLHADKAADRKTEAAEARAEFARRYAEIPYDVLKLMDTPQCRECGALVFNTTVHNQWHDSLTEAVELASSALQRNEVY